MPEVDPGSTRAKSLSVQDASSRSGTSFVEWGAVFAGAVIAAALSFVFLTFAFAIGLSLVSPWPNSGLPATMIASLAIFWILAQQIGSFMVGGYVAGRMRSRWGETTEHEVAFRDGLHGGLVWAVGVVIGGVLFLSTPGSRVNARTDVDARAVTAASVSAPDPLAYQVDVLLRPTTTAQGTAPSTTGGVSGELRAEVLRVFANSVVNGTLAEADRSYLASAVARHSGSSQASSANLLVRQAQEAETRVNDTFRAAQEAADKTRRAAVLSGFVTAASFLLALGAAWWAAQRGGQHRDNSIPARFVIPPLRRLVAWSDRLQRRKNSE